MTVIFDPQRLVPDTGGAPVAPAPGQPAPPAGAAPPQAPPPPERLWPVRGPVILGLAVLVLVTAGLAGWGSAARISGAILAPGTIEVAQQRQVVQHPDGGVVARIAARDGQRVAAGDLLLSLDGRFLTSELAIVEGQYLETLARRGRLEAERSDRDRIAFPAELAGAPPGTPAAELAAGQARLFAARQDTRDRSQDQLDRQSRQIAAEIAGIDAQLRATEAQAALIARELQDQQSLLARGLTQSARVMALEREAARMEGERGALQASRAAAGTRRSEIEVMKLRLDAERRERAEAELRDLGPLELELAERRRTLAERASRLEIRAPVSGIVHDLRVTTPRAVIRPAEPLLHLVPQDRPLLVAARVPPQVVDALQPGQPVALRIAALAARHRPEIMGLLDRVSPDILEDATTRAPYYRAEISIPPDELARLDLTLLPGMSVEAHIRTGSRSPLAYLTRPLTDYFTRAFRED